MASLRPIEANRLNSLHRCAIAPVPAKPSPTRITASGIPPHPVERDLVDILVRTTWLLRRLDRVEDEAWQDQLHRGQKRTSPSKHPVAHARANRRQVLGAPVEPHQRRPAHSHKALKEL